ncbi:MBOAT family protein [Microcoleus sp. A2-C5]|uniref:MBOAT family O-acyltransferase n=1 Tax=unclassified Microcoleus TaxID=2642155 RepID=UPI002FD63F09
MLFNSTLFLVFLVVVVYVYYLLTPQYRRWFLLLASYCFYWVWSVPYSLLMVGYTLLAYITARIIDSSTKNRDRTTALISFLVVVLSTLCLFKYANFFSDSAYSLLGFHPWPQLNLLLPLGISFYTFETISYVVDVYKRITPADKSLLDIALYVIFFPHLVAGPIIRADDLVPQLACRASIDWVRIRSGIAQIIWGMLKKVFIADPMAPIASEAFSAPESVSGLGLLLGTFAFAVQVYCDFSGYSDIAIGSSRLLGIELPPNFDRPYLAYSITDFWRRWHISLSTWLRDYLYIPLGGNRQGKLRTYVNLTITMLLGGLWHGAGWNWVVWGGLQGAMLSMERVFGLASAPKSKASYLIRWLFTFCLISISWVLFRSPDLNSAGAVLGRIFTFADGRIPIDYRPLLYLGLVLLVEWADVKQRWMSWAQMHPNLLKWIAWAIAIALMFTFAGASSSNFIYFQF